MVRTGYEMDVQRSATGDWCAEVQIAPGIAHASTRAEAIHKLARGLQMLAEEMESETEHDPIVGDSVRD